MTGGGCCKREVVEEHIDFPHGFHCHWVKTVLTTCEDIKMRNMITAAASHCSHRLQGQAVLYVLRKKIMGGIIVTHLKD